MASIVVISLTGVMIPGPVFAAVVVKGYSDKKAGFMVAIGHGVVELPLIVLIYLGFESIFTSSFARQVIGLVGGFMLTYMGFSMFKFKAGFNGSGGNVKYGSLVTGIVTTSANPYFFLWWASVGLTLTLNSTFFGLIGFITFIVVHWLCDVGWYTLLSYSVFKSKKILSEKLSKTIFTVCAFFLVLFGLWFIASSLKPLT
ncbi:MAG: LysE family translocator [Candidatus Bathyarchaeota archaeon]|nr:LysE family translocator [Candidatus Bathyarchaeota archaeon]